MATMDTRPGVVDIQAYAGDTLSFIVRVPAGYADGRTWTAQVRDTREAVTAAADFGVTPPGTGGTDAVLILPADTTRALAGGSAAVQVVRGGRSVTVRRFTGEWDVQVAGAGDTDPVTTLAQGSLTLDLDVTREAP